MVPNARAPATQVNGKLTPSPTEDEELYAELLHIRDAVLAGRHPRFRLSHAMMERLKSANLTRVSEPSKPTPASNRANIRSSTSTDRSPLTLSSSGLPGLHAPTNGTGSQPGAKPVSYAGLDPIFLEKSDSLVRAEGRLKRERIERELQVQVEHRRQTARERDPGVDAPSGIDIEAVLTTTATRVRHMSGLKLASRPGSPANSSFDENDYYSSRAQSEWSPDANPSKNSDLATGAFTADFERLDEAEIPVIAPAPAPAQSRPIAAPLAAPNASPPRNAEERPRAFAADVDDDYDPEELDDEYTPPAASVFEDVVGQAHEIHVQPVSSEEDNSEYEPGEIASASVWATNNRDEQRDAQNSPQVPVIRNHLTHIAAPQPNRVSPLAVAKGPSIELELVNGRPEVVQRPLPGVGASHMRVSSASRSENNTGPGNKKSSRKKAKKRKRREDEAQQSSKKKRAKERAGKNVPFIKDEPTSPAPMWTAIADVPHPYDHQPQFLGGRNRVDAHKLGRHGSPIARGEYNDDSLRRSKRLEALRTEDPAAARTVSSPEGLPPVARQSQDPRRVTSLQYAQMPRSPAEHTQPPHRTASLAYGEYGVPHATYQMADPEGGRHRIPAPAPAAVQYVQLAPSRSPLRLHDYQGRYYPGEPASSMMPPPAPRQFLEDQYGNRYYAAEAAPRPATRASVAPLDRRPPMDIEYERAPSRMQMAYAPQYERAESRMAPPPPPLRRAVPDEHRVYHTDSNGYSLREYGTPHAEPVHYIEQARSPVYQQPLRFETQPPPPAPMPPPAREPTSPMYAPRAYSVRPEESVPVAPAYAPRQASVAPVQYVRQEAPPPSRAMSVMPEFEQGAPPSYRSYSHAPPVRYMDQHGQVVYPPEMRQFGEYRY